jgi:hypothetical protein
MPGRINVGENLENVRNDKILGGGSVAARTDFEENR